MTTTGDILLADIIQNPAEDSLRLIYADWLSEHDDEQRAEFIRVQCDIAQAQQAIEILSRDQFLILPESNRDQRIEAIRGAMRQLRDREHELLDAAGFGWCDALLGSDWKTYGICKTSPGVAVAYGRGSYTDKFSLTFHRGCIAEVACTHDDWLKHGPHIVRCQPVEVVRVSDRKPARLSGDGAVVYYWNLQGVFLEGGCGPDSALGLLLYKKVGKLREKRTQQMMAQVVNANEAYSAECCMDDLSNAFLEWSKSVQPS